MIVLIVHSKCQRTVPKVAEERESESRSKVSATKKYGKKYLFRRVYRAYFITSLSKKKIKATARSERERERNFLVTSRGEISLARKKISYLHKYHVRVRERETSSLERRAYSRTYLYFNIIKLTFYSLNLIQFNTQKNNNSHSPCESIAYSHNLTMPCTAAVSINSDIFARIICTYSD